MAEWRESNFDGHREAATAVVIARAAAALHMALARAGELTPARVARIVARVLPRAGAAELLRGLRRRGWLRRDACLAFDLLETGPLPAELEDVDRGLLRLALFGPPGQGLAHRDRRREDVYQQLCAEIMSGAVDEASLQAISARVLHHPDVNADPMLGSMLRSFIAEREQALQSQRLTPEEVQRRKNEQSKLRRAFRPTVAHYPTREELLALHGRVQHEFDGYMSQFDEQRALGALNRMRVLRQRFPVHIPAGDLQRCEEQYDRLLKRSGTYRRQIRELAEKAAVAARTGDDKTANWVVRRLYAIHALLPNLLSATDLDKLRQGIVQGGDECDAAETARELAERQREVLDRIKRLAGAVHRYHELAGRVPADDPAFQRAEALYRQALDEIRGLNTDWLSGLVLQLETLLDDLDDPGHQFQSQLDEFIEVVRTALNRLCLEIRAHRAKPPPGASAGDAAS
jgi:hypothetical protein